MLLLIRCPRTYHCYRGRSLADFEELLKGAGVTSLVDVRLGPGSRKHPHFGKDSTAAWLPETGITYRWEQRLGGFRKLPHRRTQPSATILSGPTLRTCAPGNSAPPRND